MARPVTVFISGTRRSIKSNSFNVQMAIEERSTASFQIFDAAGSLSFEQDEPVSVYDGVVTIESGTLLFSGFIEVPEINVMPAGELVHTIICKDTHYLADKRLIVKSYTDKTLSYIVNDIITDYLSAEGITVGNISTGPTISESIFNYVTATEVFEQLKELSGYYWQINPDKSLDFQEREANAAPWNLDNITYKPMGIPKKSGGNSQYRNRQYVRGGTGVTAEQTENFTGDGATVSFPVGYPLHEAPTVTVGGAAKTVGVKGIDSGKDCYWLKGENTVVFASAPAGSAAIVIVYYGEYPLIVRADNYSEITAKAATEGGTGIVEHIVTETGHESLNGAKESAAGKLRHYCRTSSKVNFRTRTSGLMPGQMFYVTIPDLGMSAEETLIESVDIDELGIGLMYTVTAITGPALGSWSKFFSRLVTTQEKTIKLGDSLLLVLLQEQNDLDLTEATSINEDDFTGGITNRWLNSAPIDAGSLHNIEHEIINITEGTSKTTHLTEDYKWDDAGAKWDFATWS